MPTYKLGKKAPVHDSRTLKLANYLTGALPNVPTSVNWGAQVPSWPMYGNDTLGDCTIAATGHMEGLWSYKESGTEFIVPEPEIVSAYSAVSGYIPGDESTDNGAVCLDVLKYWGKTGIGGNKIYGFATCSPQNRAHIRASTYLFGSTYIGISLPVTAQAQSVPNGCWSVAHDWEVNQDAQPGSWGGHCVPVVGYNANTLCVITWGMVLYLTWNFWAIYTDEAYACLSPQWVPGGVAVAPDKFNLAQLQADLKLVKG